jgi:hypothetical protein
MGTTALDWSLGDAIYGTTGLQQCPGEIPRSSKLQIERPNETIALWKRWKIKAVQR